jgi:hypothetical protein
MFAPLKRIIPEPELLPEVRSLLSLCPELVDYPEHLATELEVQEQNVQVCLEALEVEGEVLA